MSSRSASIALFRSIHPRTIPAALADLLSAMRQRTTTLWHVLCLYRRRARERAELRSLSRREVLDFCPKGAEADREMHKPFWRV
jgi:uncharacterized protein YjiS (DUF1127 family)